MRSSAEALCPIPKQVRDPSDTRYSIEEVFFNICGFTEGNRLQKMEVGLGCYIESHLCLIFK